MRETKLWTLFLLAGVVILFLLGFHMLYTHAGTVLFGVEDNLAKGISQGRDASPVYTTFFIVMLAAGLFHGLYGLRVILFELGLKPFAEKAVSTVCCLLGVGLFCLGTFAAIKAHGNAAVKSAPGVALVQVGRG